MSFLPTASGRVAEQALQQSARPGVFNQTVNAALGGLGTVGQVLDTPASTIRGIINAVKTDEADFGRAFTGIFNTEERVSGSELIFGEDKANDFTLAGLAVEIATDPLTFVTFGSTTSAGQLARRAGKLATTADAQRTLSRQGSKFAAKRLGQSEEALETVEQGLRRLGRDPRERLQKSLSKQFTEGQRDLLRFDIPFTSISNTLINGQNQLGGIAGSGASAIGRAVTENPAAEQMRKLFVTKFKDPVMEEIRKETRREITGLTSEARKAGEQLNTQRMRLLAQTKDPNIDLKVITALEEADVALDENLGGRISAEAARKLLRARLTVEELYGSSDQWDEIWAFAQQVRQFNKQLLDIEQAAGLPTTELDNMGYFARIMTNEARQLIRNNKQAQIVLRNHLAEIDAGRVQNFSKERNLKSLNIGEANSKVAKALGKDPNKFKVFDTDIVSVQVNRMVSTARQVGDARFSAAVVDRFGEKVSKEALKNGAQVGVEKIIKPRGSLVRNVRLTVDASAEGIAELLSARFGRLKTGATKFGDEGIKLTENISIKDATPQAVRAAVAFRSSKRFSKLGEKHAQFDGRLKFLVKQKILTNNQAKLIRTIAAQIPEEGIPDGIASFSERELQFLEQINGLSEGRLSNVLGRASPSASVGTQGEAAVTNVLPSNVEPGGTGTVLALRENLPDLSASQPGGPIGTFLHELGHIHYWTMLNDADKAALDRLIRDAQAESVKNSARAAEAGITDRGIIRSILDTNIKGVDNNPSEFYSEMFARWMQGNRTTDKTLETLFRKTSRDYHAARMLQDLGKDIERASGTLQGSSLSEAITGIGDTVSGTLVPNFRIINESLNVMPASERKEFFTELAEELHTRTRYVEFDADATPKQIKKAFKEAGVDRTALPTEVAEEAERFLGRSRLTATEDSFWTPFLRTMDEIHSLYRTALTQYVPAFHARNMFSNMFMNAMAGDVRLNHYHQAFKELQNMTPERSLELGNLQVLDSGKVREVFEYMQQTKGGISDAMKQVVGNVTGKVGLRNAAFRAGTSVDNFMRRNVGNTIEDVTRLAHFLAKKDKGLTDVEAADSVVKFLFDYQDLTDFERALPRRTLLFYTFMRKNIPLMVEQTAKNPRFMQLYARATGQVNANIQQPEWLPDSFFLGETEKGNMIRLNFGLPPEDLARFDPTGEGLGRSFEILLSSTVPAIKEPIQFATGIDLFTSRPLEGGTAQRLASALPTSRFTATGERVVRAATDPQSTANPVGEIAAFATAIRPRVIDPEMQKEINKLNAVQDRLKELVRSGKARSIEIVGQRRGQENPEVQTLNSLAGQIRANLSRMSETQ